jgi:hypothetical protein
MEYPHNRIQYNIIFTKYAGVEIRSNGTGDIETSARILQIPAARTIIIHPVTGEISRKPKAIIIKGRMFVQNTTRT